MQHVVPWALENKVLSQSIMITQARPSLLLYNGFDNCSGPEHTPHTVFKLGVDLTIVFSYVL